MATFRPHPYQAYAIDRIMNQANVGLFLDMGLGKTVITLTAVDRLIHQLGIVKHVLIIAPKKVAEATWQAEAAKWDHLRGLTIATALGSAREREAAIDARAEITIINRENVAWLVEHYGLGWIFDMVVVDESSSFKSPGAQRFKALKRMLPKIHSVVILTGTPAPNGIEDLWAQVYLLDRGERLGRYITHYRQRYFDHNPWRHEYVPKPGAFEAVQKRISDICVSMKAEDWLQLPELVVHDMPVKLDPQAEKVYRRMEREMVMEVGDSAERSEAEPASAAKQDAGETRDPQGVARARGVVEISATSAAALTGKLLQLCGGAVYDEAGECHIVHGAKLDALGELIEQLNGEHALLFYGYRHEVPRLESVLEGKRWRLLETAADAAAWNRGEVDVLLAHPASCAYGLNLQEGGRHVIWYTLTWSLELYQQANARLHRQGQEKPVIVHRLLVHLGASGEAGPRASSPAEPPDAHDRAQRQAWGPSMDEDVAKALEAKDETQAALIEALKARIERWKN